MQSTPTWEYALGRTGLIAKGVAWALVGLLAILLAAGVGAASANQQGGALHALAANAFGEIVLILLAIGFAAYAAWRVLQAVTVREPDAKKAWGARAGYVGSAAVYALFVYTAAKLVAGSGGQSQNQKAHKAAAVVLSWPGGTVLVGLAGAGLVIAGLWNLYRGVSGTFEEKWRSDISRSARRWGYRAGVVGHVSRLIVFGLIGWFVIKAAADYNPNDAVSLDGALQKLAGKSFGPYLLGLTAAGLFAYAAFCMFDAFNRDLTR